MFYYLFFYRKIYQISIEKKKGAKRDVSVIICAHNEADNLKKNLTAVLRQSYHNFEVIVVDDASTDKTAEVLQNFQKEYNQLKVITIEQSSKKAGKKNALTIGIYAASFNTLLMTDADCCPVSEFWIEAFAEVYNENVQMVLGYGAYRKHGGLLNKIIRWETAFIALQYSTFALRGLAYMGVGRNISYSKKLFIENNGFEAHKNIAGGDDDLFVSQIAENTNIKICFNKLATTVSEPERSFKNWFRQKQRHISVSNKYKPLHKILLAAEPFTRILYYATWLLSLFFQEIFFLTIPFFFIRLVTQMIIFSETLNKFSEKDLLPYGICFDIAIPLLYAWIFVLNFFNPLKNKWK